MSRPAISCSCRYSDTASTYCSRNWLFTIASRKLREPRFCVYQLGRGSEPVIVVGSMMSLVARSMTGISPEWLFRWPLVYVCRAPLGNHLRQFIARGMDKTGTTAHL